MHIYQQSLSFIRQEHIFYGHYTFLKSDFATLKAGIKHFLHAEEELYFSTLKYEKRQHSYLLGRYAAKNSIAAMNSLPLKDIQIESGIFGQPIVQCSAENKLQVCFSHCDDLAVALAFPEAHPVGIDIEKISNNRLNVIENQMTREELQLLQVFSHLEKNYLLTAIWTSKEALSKIIKTGLMISLDVLAISKIQNEKDYCVFEFKNFPQYHSLYLQLGTYGCSLVYPKRTQLDIDKLSMQNFGKLEI